MLPLIDLQNTHAGRPALILGGGPSLPADYERITTSLRAVEPSKTKFCRSTWRSNLPAPLHIAVNYHADMIGIPYDFIVYNDFPEHDRWMLECLQRTDAIKVSPEPSSDIDFGDVDVWTGNYSSCTATWFALWLGCDPVILLGHDLYQGEQKHCHPDERDPDWWHFPVDRHLRPWLEEAPHKLPHFERVFVASGPLQRIFPIYNL
jgi:hypothetical protein